MMIRLTHSDDLNHTSLYLLKLHKAWVHLYVKYFYQKSINSCTGFIVGCSTVLFKNNILFCIIVLSYVRQYTTKTYCILILLHYIFYLYSTAVHAVATCKMFFAQWISCGAIVYSYNLTYNLTSYLPEVYSFASVRKDMHLYASCSCSRSNTIYFWEVHSHNEQCSHLVSLCRGCL